MSSWLYPKKNWIITKAAGFGPHSQYIIIILLMIVECIAKTSVYMETTQHEPIYLGFYESVEGFRVFVLYQMILG